MRVVLAALFLALPAVPAFAQVDFSGAWASLYHEDLPERLPGPELGDYMGLPINDAAHVRNALARFNQVTFEDEELGVEEGYLYWTGLPGRLRVDVGKFRSQVGDLNRWHLHALPETEYPLVYRRFLSDEGLVGIGLSLSTSLPVSLAGGTHEIWVQGTTAESEPLFGQGREPSLLLRLQKLSPTLGFAVGIVRGVLTRSAVGNLLVRIGQGRSIREIERDVAWALGDPSARIAVREKGSGMYVTVDDKPIDNPSSGAPGTTLMESGGASVAILHDPSLLRDQPERVALLNGALALLRIGGPGVSRSQPLVHAESSGGVLGAQQGDLQLAIPGGVLGPLGRVHTEFQEHCAISRRIGRRTGLVEIAHPRRENRGPGGCAQLVFLRARLGARRGGEPRRAPPGRGRISAVRAARDRQHLRRAASGIRRHPQRMRHDGSAAARP